MTDFRRVLSIILSAARNPANGRTDAQAREDTVYRLDVLRRYSLRTDALDEEIDEAVRFVQSDAWPMIYTRIKLNGYPRVSASPQAVEEVERALEREFDAIAIEGSG